MNTDDIKKIKTQEEARQYAIDWQIWSSGQSMSWADVFKWQAIFIELGERFDLMEEFEANAIV